MTPASSTPLRGSGSPLTIRPYRTQDSPAVWGILEPVIRAGETYALDPDMGREDALRLWTEGAGKAFVAELEGEIVGTYYLRPNHGGGGRHVCNCGYMTHPGAQGRGVARAMCSHSLEHARSQGYRAMQFNFVVSTNSRAVALWESFGFRSVGRLPGAFLHPKLGYVDALVMYREL